MERTDGIMSLRELFDDQRAFNSLIYTRTDENLERIRSLSLGMVEETLEFLRTFEWKTHRRIKGRLLNVAHSHEELIDMFKYWLSLVDVSDFPIDEIEQLYYAKSRVVQYRYQEEWLKEIDRPSVIVDIDDVLADYISGMCAWAREWAPTILKLTPAQTMQFITRLDTIRHRHQYLSSTTVGVPSESWRRVKHDFRTRGGKRTIPVFTDARPFLDWCRQNQWIIILITSRPIDRYPNLFTDTIMWLDKADLPFDHLWWSDRKSERLEETHIVMRSQIMFAVDDDPTFVHQFASKGIKTYWLVRGGGREELEETESNVHLVHSLDELMKKEQVHVV